MAVAAAADAREGAPGAPVIEVIEAFELASLVARAGTLDGSVPLRAAQACVPLLEGNAYGLQVRLARPLVIERPLGRPPRVADERATIDAKAQTPRLRALGYVGEAWARAFARAPVHARGGVLHVFTGLLVRPPDGAWLRVASSANRRSLAYDVDEVFVPDGVGFVPLVIPIRPRASGALRLDAEIATLGCVAPGAAIARAELEGARALFDAHAAFYDAAYFAHKKGGEPTRKYRKQLRAGGPPTAPAVEAPRVVQAGPGALEIERRDAILTGDAPTPTRARERFVAAISFSALLPFEARWDGLSVVLAYDAARLAREARALERRLSAALGAEVLAQSRGAVLYLTKYFTPHPPGEPHFFVKPWAFVQTPPGWSSLVDGVLGDGFETLRGVVATDGFHATPAVFRITSERARVAEGARLISVVPFPRSLASPIAKVTKLGIGP